MQDEREPDIMGADDEALEEKVREMMEPKAEKPKPTSENNGSEAEKASTAPEVVGLPVPKEPLKIKIIKADPEEDAGIGTAPALPAKSKSKKKIAVKHEEPDESEPLETDLEASNTEEIPITTPEELIKSAEYEKGAGQIPVDTKLEDTDTQELAADTDSQSIADDTEAESQPESSPEATSQEAGEEPPLPPVIEDNKTKEAVDDIVAHESDVILAAEDEKVAAAFKPPEKPKFKQKLKNFLAAWWHNPKARWLTLSALFLVVVAVMIVPTSRYFLLNTARVRSSLSVQVLDNSTQQPLKNVKVSIGGSNGVTDTDGRARLTKVRLGPARLRIEKRAFAPIEQQVTVGWGSNPLGEFKLVPTGSQYAFLVTDFLSAKGVEGIEATSGESSAQSDRDGKILLTLEEPADEFEVIVKGDGFREEKLRVNADVKTEQAIRLVPARKAVFISKRSGVYDVYKVDIDGKNEEKILAGTGSEREDILVLPHPKEEIVAVVSTRDNVRNADGFLLSTLNVIDLTNNSPTAPAKSEQIRLLGWVNDRLIYMQATAGASAANPKRQKLMSYNYKTDENKELFTSNYFNDLGVIGSKIYFAPSGAYQAGSSGLYSLETDGTNKQTILTQEVWTLTRTSYEHLSLSVGSDWYQLRIGDKTATKLPGQPANLAARSYTDSPDGKKSLWVDNRDGKGVLLAYEPDSKNEQVLRTQSGLKNPVRWLSNDAVIYRINTEQETADYALSLQGGEPQKIRDVTHTNGTDSWYYY